MLKILSCGRNTLSFIDRYFETLKNQTFHKPFEIFMIFDDPEDTGYHVARTRAKYLDIPIDIQINHPLHRKHQPRNFYEGVHTLCTDDEDICCIVDIDDYLMPNALDLVYMAYVENPNCLMTYGTFQREGRQDLEFQGPLPKDGQFRKHPWISSHLKTFKYKLFKHIQVKDFKDDNGEWFKRTGDQVIMYPMLEMAGLDRIVRIEKIIYILNGQVKEYPEETERFKVHEIVRARKPYERLNLEKAASSPVLCNKYICRQIRTHL